MYGWYGMREVRVGVLRSGYHWGGGRSKWVTGGRIRRRLMVQTGTFCIRSLHPGLQTKIAELAELGVHPAVPVVVTQIESSKRNDDDDRDGKRTRA